jgi:hypothetical protein
MVAGESKTEFEALKGTEVMEFFRILKIFQQNIKRKLQHGKNNT